MQKSSVEEIRARFDADVERFSNLDTAQAATVDAPLVLDLITSVAAAVNPSANRIIDVGCGAGNYTLKLLQRVQPEQITLVDLSRPMLDRAVQRISAVSTAKLITVQEDVRQIDLGAGNADIILAAAVLHHLRTDEEWEAVFRAFHRALTPGGSLWISDLVTHSTPSISRLMWDRYGVYLASLKDDAYRDHVLAYVEKEDTPRPLEYQLHLLHRVGFGVVEVLHKNSLFAAFGAIKTP